MGIGYYFLAAYVKGITRLENLHAYAIGQLNQMPWVHGSSRTKWLGTRRYEASIVDFVSEATQLKELAELERIGDEVLDIAGRTNPDTIGLLEKVCDLMDETAAAGVYKAEMRRNLLAAGGLDTNGIYNYRQAIEDIVLPVAEATLPLFEETGEKDL